jgi:hypothetical protein
VVPAAASETSPPNPFSTRFVRPDQSTFRFSEGKTAQSVAARLSELLMRRGTAAIIGPHGTGKSTLVHTLIAQLEHAFASVDRIQLSSAIDCRAELQQWQREKRLTGPPKSLKEARCLVIDGFEQLDWITRRRLIWQAMRWQSTSLGIRFGQPRRCLLLTAHRPQLGVSTFYRTGWDETIVRQLTQEKLAHLSRPERLSMFRAADRHVAAWNQLPTASRNVRDYWFALYDQYEQLRAPSPAPIAIAPDLNQRIAP